MIRKLLERLRRAWTNLTDMLVSKSDLWFGLVLCVIIVAVLATMWNRNDKRVERMASSLDPDRGVACYYLEHVNGDITALGCVKYGSGINEQAPR